MSTQTPGLQHQRASNGSAQHDAWLDHTRVFLQPIAAPSILGLFGFAGATFMVAAVFAGWYGGPLTNNYLFPFAATFGGIAQFAAAMWSYRARDGMATATHGLWGSFWMAFGILYLLNALHVLTVPVTSFTPLGYWFIVLAVITGFCFVAALRVNLGISSVLLTLAAGAACVAIYYWTGATGWERVGGWLLLVSSWIACYTAGAMMIAGAWGRTVLPLGEYKKAANVPGRRPMDFLQYEMGEPGVRQGQ